LKSFDINEFGECLKKFVSIERDWIPNSLAASLYIRPTFIGLEVNYNILLNYNNYKPILIIINVDFK
jgi:hypothetical protein